MLQASEFARMSDFKIAPSRRIRRNSLLISLLAGEFESGDGFDCNCVRHHAVLRVRRFPDNRRKCGQLADFLICVPVSERLPRAGRRFWPGCLWASEFRFLGKQRLVGERPVRSVATRGGQTEHAVLARPFRRKFAETRDTHSIGQTPFNGRPDEIGCKECKRGRHIDLTHAATLSLSDRFNGDGGFSYELVQPPSSFGN